MNTPESLSITKENAASSKRRKRRWARRSRGTAWVSDEAWAALSHLDVGHGSDASQDRPRRPLTTASPARQVSTRSHAADSSPTPVLLPHTALIDSLRPHTHCLLAAVDCTASADPSLGTQHESARVDDHTRQRPHRQRPATAPACAEHRPACCLSLARVRCDLQPPACPPHSGTRKRFSPKKSSLASRRVRMCRGA